ncbi:MAG: hypothetical protein RL557_118 [archaeon]|jgi:hypothetical protein
MLKKINMPRENFLDKFIGGTIIAGLAYIAIQGAYNEHLENQRKIDDAAALRYFSQMYSNAGSEEQFNDQNKDPAPYSPFFESK